MENSGPSTSCLCDPNAALFVTLTGTISLLNLLEDLVNNGVIPLLINTDGIYIRVPVTSNWRESLGAWSGATGFEIATEPVDLLLVGSVNDVATMAVTYLGFRPRRSTCGE